MKVSRELSEKILELAGLAPAAPAPLAETVDEAAFMTAVIGLARENGWLVYHTRDSRKSQAGFVDLVLVRHYVLWLECKTESGQPTAAQVSWGEALLAAGQDYRLVRPSDWSEITRVLTEPKP